MSRTHLCILIFLAIVVVASITAGYKAGQRPGPQARRGLDTMLKLCDEPTVKHRVIASDNGVAFIALCTPSKATP